MLESQKAGWQAEGKTTFGLPTQGHWNLKIGRFCYNGGQASSGIPYIVLIPYPKKKIVILEVVQRRLIRPIPGMRGLSY